jgi:hypothetical protein
MAQSVLPKETCFICVYIVYQNGTNSFTTRKLRIIGSFVSSKTDQRFLPPGIQLLVLLCIIYQSGPQEFRHLEI